MPTSCVVGGCTRNCVKNPGLFWITFPKNATTQRQWVRFVNHTRSDFSLSETSRICSAHFTDDSIDETVRMKWSLGLTARFKLKEGSVPTIKAPTVLTGKRLDIGTHSDSENCPPCAPHAAGDRPATDPAQDLGDCATTTTTTSHDRRRSGGTYLKRERARMLTDALKAGSSTAQQTTDDATEAGELEQSISIMPKPSKPVLTCTHSPCCRMFSQVSVTSDMANTSPVPSDGENTELASGSRSACTRTSMYVVEALDLNTPCYEVRYKEGTCLECCKLFSKGENGWRRVSLAALEKFSPKDLGLLQMYYGVSQGYLCIECVCCMFQKGKLSSCYVLPTNSPGDPPVCLECGSVFYTDHRDSSISIRTLESKNVFVQNRYGVAKGILCNSCVSHLLPISVQKSVGLEATEKIVNGKRGKDGIPRPHKNHTSLASKIVCITMKSGKKIYGTSKRAVIVQEMRRYKSRYGLCTSCKCRTHNNTNKKRDDETKLESYTCMQKEPKRTQKEPKRTQKEPKRTCACMEDQVMLEYSKSRYERCTITLADTNPRAFKQMHKIVHASVKHEVRKYKKEAKNLLTGQKLSEKSMRNFSWATIVKEARTCMPNLVGMLSSIFSNPPKKFRRDRNVDMLVEARLGFIIALITYALTPTFSLVQSLLSLEAWKFGVAPEMHERLESLGILRHRDTARRYVENMHREEMKHLEGWIEEAVTAPKTCVKESEKDTMSVAEHKTSIPVDLLPPQINKGLGFCLFWKEIKMEVGSSKFNYGRTVKGVVLFAVRNRANFSHLSEKHPSTQAKDIPLKDLLPDHDDYTELRQRMHLVVYRILAKHFGLTDMSHPIHHQYSDRMKEMSEIVHLGIMKEDPSTNSGFKAILQELSKYVPVDQQGQPVPTPLYADAQTVKKIITMNLDADATSSRVRALVPVTHEFFKIRTYLQELFDSLHWHQSRGDKGTIFQLMEAFAYITTFSEDDDKRCAFLQCLTEGHVIMLAKNIAKSEGLDFGPEAKNVQENLNQLASAIVGFLWCEDYEDQIQEVLTAEEHSQPAKDLEERSNMHVDEETAIETDDGCPCKQKKKEGMIRCAYMRCPVGNFHLSCVGITPRIVPDDEWYCSDDCETVMTDDTYAFCFCHKYQEEEQMIQCELAGRCTGNQWYHLSCLKMNENDIPDTWFCCDACQVWQTEPTQDHIQNYAKELTWQVLKYMTRMDAIHEGDGKALLSYSKMDLLHFWNTNNWTLTIVLHKFLTGINGLYSPRLTHELMWNRVANITGLPSDNVCLDHVDELINRDYRATMKHWKGILSERQGKRHNLNGGRLASLHHMFFSKDECELLGRIDTSQNLKEVQSLVENYEDQRLFDHVPGRHHNAFPDFKADHKLRDPQLLAGELKKLGELLDGPKVPHV